jgi:hypothetical protein
LSINLAAPTPPAPIGACNASLVWIVSICRS